MAKIAISILSFLLLLPTGGAQMSAENRASIDEFIGKLEARVNSLMTRYEIPGVSIALIKEGELVWANAYGYAVLSASPKVGTV